VNNHVAPAVRVKKFVAPFPYLFGSELFFRFVFTVYVGVTGGSIEAAPFLGPTFRPLILWGAFLRARLSGAPERIILHGFWN
jgi:hypothetical protein